MLEALLEQADDMMVVEAVENEAPVAPRSHQPHASQEPQLMRDGGLGQTEQLGEIADAQFGPRQRVQHPHPRHVAEHLEGFGERRGRLVAQQLRADGGRRLGYHRAAVM